MTTGTLTKIVAVSKQSVKLAAQALAKGGIVAYPTETSYALGCDATNSKAVGKIFSLKGRERGKPLPVIVDSLKTIGKYALLDERVIGLAERFTPGPLTLVIRLKKGALPSSLSKNGVAFRISSNSFAKSLAQKLGKPIVSTSANPSGKPPIYSANEIVEKYFGKIDVIVDSGELRLTVPSTIVDLRGKEAFLIRSGPIQYEKILQELNLVGIKKSRKQLVKK